MSTSDFYELHNPPGLKAGAITANICEMLYFLILVIFIHSMGRESLIETTRVRMYTSFILGSYKINWMNTWNILFDYCITFFNMPDEGP